IDTQAIHIPDAVEVLVVVHPRSLTEETLFAIDQFVMRGGRLLAFVDPLAEMDRPQQPGGMMSMPGNQTSDLNRLLSAWGLLMREDKFIGDAQMALEVSGGPSGRPVRHLGILGLMEENLSADDVVTASLSNINVTSAGILDIDEDATTRIEPLMQSSSHAMPLDASQLAFMSSPEDLQQGFSPTGERYLLAARISGSVVSAFPDRVAQEPDAIAKSDDINVIVVADTDILSDRLWVQVQNFFGQRIASPWANNGDFVTNAVDNLVGSSALISVRSRGRFTRPFEIVQDLRREAEGRYLESANDLQARLSETERKLSELEAERNENNLLALSPEQEAALDRFQQEKLRIRKQLRDVRHQLDRDIELLGTTLKFLNIFLLPLMLTLMLAMAYFLLTRRAHRIESQVGSRLEGTG
ncbi:MAG: Gldg family protein, partial [Pseudomonadales bacterium]